MEKEKLFTKKDLEEAFNKGMSYDYRPSFFPSFNKWFNKHYANLFVSGQGCCDTCKFNEQNKQNVKKCKECINCNLYEQQTLR